MHTRLILLVVFLLQFMPSISYANQNEWMFKGISGVDVFGKYDPNVISVFNDTYNRVRMNVSQDKITINDDLLGQLCFAKYVEIKRTPLSYFMAENTVELYSQLLKHENRSFPEEFSVITTIYSGEGCQAPYREILKINDELIVIEKGYMLFFTEVTSESDANNTTSKPDVFATYCDDLNPGKEFDGSSEYMCKFEGVGLEQAYKKITSISYVGRNFFKHELPVADVKYSIKEKTVTYHRTENTLNILVDSENESFNYVFTVHHSGTTVKITDETQY